MIERNAPKAVHGELHLSEPSQAEAYLESLKKRMFPPDIRVETHVHTTATTDVARSIVEHVQEFHSDLVMMSTHGKSGIRTLLFGNIAEQIVALRVPVLLVRPGGNQDQNFMNQPLLIPLDGTLLREQALGDAAAMAIACGVGLNLLMIVPTLQTLSGIENASKVMLPSTTQEMLDLMNEDAVTYLQQWISKLADQGLHATAEIKRGDFGEMILAATQRTDIGLIVLATVGKTGMNAFWSSCITSKVSNRTHLPLLLIPATEE